MLQSSRQVKTVLSPYTRIAWVNPTTGKQMSIIFDQYENDALEELEDSLTLDDIPFERDVLRPL